MKMLRGYFYKLATDKSKGLFAFLIKPVLFLLSIFYGMIIWAVIFAQRLRRVDIACPLISVGNITVGGTGKTSMVEYIVRFLQKEGRVVAVLSRGYKRPLAKPGNPEASYGVMGDEPYMLHKRLGVAVVVGKNRVKSADYAISRYAPQAIILDDGFQQWKLKKDLEIVTIDAGNPFGNRQMLPRGILRQPLSSLIQADVIVLTKTNLVNTSRDTIDTIKKINQKALILEAAH